MRLWRLVNGWARAAPTALLWTGLALLVGGALIAAGSLVSLGWDSGDPQQQFGPKWAIEISQPVGLLVSAAGLFLETVGLMVGRQRSISHQLEDRDAHLRRLREDTRTFWSKELAARRMSEPRPIKVRWRLVTSDIAPTPATVLTARAERRKKNIVGTVNKLPEWFERWLRDSQLIVLGTPGAGKSSALAVLMAELPRDTAWIPVLVEVRTWNPTTTSIDQLTEQALERAGHPPALAKLERVVPVLDGLDEIRAVHYPEAMALLRQRSAEHRPFIASSRTLEYMRAKHVAGQIPANAAVIELEPVTLRQVASYLAPDPTLKTHWRPVTKHLDDDPTGHLAMTLSTPLMTWLARETLAPGRKSTPHHLVQTESRVEAQNLLLENYLPTVYPNKPYRIPRITRWLTTFDRLPTITRYDIPFTWLDFITAVTITALTYGALTIIPSSQNGPRVLIAAALTTALAVGTASSVQRRVTAPRIREELRTPRDIVLFFVALWLTTGSWLIVLFGLLAALTCMVRTLVQFDLRAGLVPSSRALTVTLLFVGALAACLQPVLGPPLDRWFQATIICFAGISTIRTWPHIQNWLGRARLVASGQLPICQKKFLNTAHARGIIRHTPAGYQLRHQIITDHLTDKDVAQKFGNPNLYYEPSQRRWIKDVSVRGRRHPPSWGHLAAHPEFFNRLDRLTERPPSFVRHMSIDPKNAAVLAAHGDTDALRTEARNGNDLAAYELTRILSAHGDTNALRTEAHNGNRSASEYLRRRTATLSADARHADALRTRARNGYAAAADELAELLAAKGDTDALRTEARNGNHRAGYELADILARRGHTDALRSEARHGTWHAGKRLTELLRDRGDTDALRTEAHHGNTDAAHEVVRILTACGDADALLDEACAGNERAREVYLRGLMHRGEISKLRIMAEEGFPGAAFRVALMRACVGRWDTLMQMAEAGDASASAYLAMYPPPKAESARIRIPPSRGRKYTPTEPAVLSVAARKAPD
ncbi:hypothetical protein [uncultured Serinicoccus sp.]|uniref:hypothetical protein n=1 Tax=uncultured Serinicoccus sp. TaxID=735514 RepID=UPI002630B2DA|nr:hypothetical protein [uncultured Serinicoccus sp.]